MADLVSMPVVKPSTFLAMKQEAKATLTQDLNLDKSADLSAQRQALLANADVPAGLKKAQLKELNRKVAHWTKKVRQPFGEGSDVGGVGHDDTAVAPAESMIKALINTIKSPGATPAVTIRKPKRRPVDDLTPVATPPTRPAKKKAKQALGGYQEPGPSTPLTAPPELLDPQEKRKSAVSKGKQLAKKYAKKKGKQVALDAAKKWLDF